MTLNGKWQRCPIFKKPGCTDSLNFILLLLEYHLVEFCGGGGRGRGWEPDFLCWTCSEGVPIFKLKHIVCQTLFHSKYLESFVLIDRPQLHNHFDCTFDGTTVQLYRWRYDVFQRKSPVAFEITCNFSTHFQQQNIKTNKQIRHSLMQYLT